MFLFCLIDNFPKISALSQNPFFEEVINLIEDKCLIFLSQEDLFKYIKPCLITNQFDSKKGFFTLYIEKDEFDKQLNRSWINKEERYIAFPCQDLFLVYQHSLVKKKIKYSISKIFNYHNTLFSISASSIYKLQTFGVEFNDAYLDSLCGYINPHYIGSLSGKLETLICCDITNKQFFSSPGNKVVIYKEQPIIYDNFVDALMDDHNYQNEVNLLSLHENGIFPQSKTTQEYTNFGVTIRVKTYLDEQSKIDCLRKTMHHIYSWSKNRYLEEDFIKHKESCLLKKCDTLEDYILQGVKYRAFRFAYDYLSLYQSNDNFTDPSNDHLLTINEYSYNLQSLLNRYSKNGESVFEKVEDLNDYDGYTGIYILCFDDEMKMYIGQTKQSLKKRITSHFTKPQSDFDKTHTFDRISSIYILHTTSEFIDYVEADCIANINANYLLNKLAANGSIELIDSKSYDPKNYMISPEGIIDIVNDVEKAKNYNRKNIEWDNWIKEEKKAFDKLQRIMDKNKTEELCLQAVRYSGTALSYVPENLKTEKVCYEAFTHYHEPEVIFKLIPPSILSESFIMKLVKHNKKTIKILPLELITPNIEKIAKIKK